jgi:peptide/nickel transport system permease protein
MPERAARLWRSAVLRLATIVLVVLVAGILCTTLVRFAPGFGSDERQLDARLSNESVAGLRSQHDAERNVAKFYVTYLAGLMRGDFGSSHLFSQPISQLLKDRVPVTVRSIGLGLAMAWLVALACALCATAMQNAVADATLAIGVGVLLSLPAAVLGLFVIMARKPASLAIALAVAPVLYRWCRNVLQRSWVQPWTLAARAKGLSTREILFRHVVPLAAPQLIALAGVSLNMAFGAALPVEVVADSAGVGQLAWQAAMGRDLPLLVTITALVAAVTLTANAAASLTNEALQPVAA